ncbi:MAG: hypothetical protein QM791_06995 [Ferruginibacter sp.]
MRREAIIFIVLSVGIVLLTLSQSSQISAVFGFIQLVLYLAFFFTIIYAIYRLVHDHRPIPDFDKAKPLMLGCILGCAFFFMSYILDTDGGKKRLYVAGVNNKTGFIHFQLFDDNTFKLLDAGAFGGKIYRGNYSLVNDTLILNNPGLKTIYPTLRMVLKDGANGSKYFEPIGGDLLKNMLFVEPERRSKQQQWDNIMVTKR